MTQMAVRYLPAAKDARLGGQRARRLYAELSPEPKPPRRVILAGARCSNRPRAADVPVEVEARPTPVGAGLLLSAARRLVLPDRVELPDDTGSSSRISGRSVTRAQTIHPSSVLLSPFPSRHALVCVEADAVCCRSSLYVHVHRRVANRRPCQTSLHHRGREISVIDEATRDRTLVSPVPFDLFTPHGAVCDELPESLLRNPSGGPHAVIAGLCQLGCVDPEQSYTLVAELQPIAACDLRDLLKRGRGRDEENPEGNQEAHPSGAPCRGSGGVSRLHQTIFAISERLIVIARFPGALSGSFCNVSGVR